MEAIKLYTKLAGARIASQMQYPTSFIMSVLSSFLASFIDVIGLFIIFTRFEMIEGWLLSEICLLYGLLHVSFSITETIARGFDTFGRLIRTGHLDRILVRPQSVILQVLGSEFKTANIGRLVQGLIPLIYALITIGFSAFWQYGLLVLALFNAMTIFFALLLVQATFSFWANDSIEAMNAFTYGGLQMGQFPLSIYEKWFATFFTYVVPISLAVYFPTVLALGKTEDAYYHAAGYLTFFGPIYAVAFFIGSLLFFRYGLSKYTSTGS